MTSAELDNLVRRIGDAFTERLGTPVAAAPACGCTHTVEETAPADWKKPAGGLAPLLEVSVCEAVGKAEMIASTGQARSAGLAAAVTGLGHVAAAEQVLRGSKTRPAVRIGSPQSAGMAEADVAAASAAARVGARQLELAVANSAMRDGEWDETFAALRIVGTIARRSDAVFLAAIDATGLPQELLLRAAALAHLAGVNGVSVCGPTANGISMLRRAVGDTVDIVADSPSASFGTVTHLLNAGATRVRVANPGSILAQA